MTNKELTGNLLVKQLTDLINGANAHATFEDTTANLPLEVVGIKPGNLPYSIWKLVEHIRITQRDILEFSRDANHVSPKWPEEYWVPADAPLNEDEWQKSLNQITKDKNDFIKLLNEPGADLYTPFAHSDGQNLLREAMLIADHTSYHSGQILVLRRLLNAWI